MGFANAIGWQSSWIPVRLRALPEKTLVILSAAKDLAATRGLFASLRMATAQSRPAEPDHARDIHLSEMPAAGDYPAGVDLAAHVRCPLCAAEYPLDAAVANAPPALIPVDAAPAEKFADVAQGEFAGPQESPEQVVQTTEGELSAADQDNLAPADAADSPEQVSEVLPFSERMHPMRPKRRQKSGLQTLLEVVTGGLAGTLFAYYALAWWQGPAFELPRFGLPLVEWLTAAPAKPGEKAETSAEKKPTPNDQPSDPAAAANATPEKSAAMPRPSSKAESKSTADPKKKADQQK